VQRIASLMFPPPRLMIVATFAEDFLRPDARTYTNYM
jgi:hypothetical protein